MGALEEIGHCSWSHEMLGYQLEHLLVCACVPIIVALQLHVCVHVEPPLECGSDF